MPKLPFTGAVLQSIQPTKLLLAYILVVTVLQFAVSMTR